MTRDPTLTPPHAHGGPQRHSLVSTPGWELSPILGSGLVRTPPSVRSRAGQGGGVPSNEERHVLARTLGAELRAVRSEVRMTQRTLAVRAGVSCRSVQDLEAGRRRPSGAMLHALAVGSTRRLPPAAADAGPVLGRLLAAAGGSLVVDTAGGVRRRQRRLRDAARVYVNDLDRWWAGECARAQQAELAFVSAITILDQPGALDDPAALDASGRALERFGAWLHEERTFRPPFGTTPEFYKMARRHGYPMRRKGRSGRAS